jgi:serine protease inhibitor
MRVILRKLVGGGGGDSIKSESKNVHLSPVSVYLALCIAWCGSAGITRIELNKALGFAAEGDGDKTAYLVALQGFLHQLAAPSDKATIVQLAHSIWCDDTIPTFTALCAKYLSAKSHRIESASVINEWISRKTNGKIKHVLQINPSHKGAVLVNTAYFKGQWQKPFESHQVCSAQFTKADSKQVKLDIQLFSQKFQAEIAHTRQKLCLHFRKAYGLTIRIWPGQSPDVDQVGRDGPVPGNGRVSNCPAALRDGKLCCGVYSSAQP